MIQFNEKTRIFKLDTKSSSYVMSLSDGILYHLYWGKRFSDMKRGICAVLPYKGIGFSAIEAGSTNFRSADVMPMEYPTYGSPDLRTPALHIRYKDGSSATALRYVSHTITDGKPVLCGLPATYCQPEDKVKTLAITLADKVSGITVTLNYTVWYDYDAIARSVVIRNDGEAATLLSAYSAAFDMIDGSDYDMLGLYGVWARERNPERLPLRHGIQLVDSKRGTSSHNQNPFVALLSKDCTEQGGEAYGLNLIYSGNFAGGVELDGYDTARVFMGINSFDFGYKLETGEEFTTPEAVLVYSDKGLGGMSRSYHRLYRERLCRGKYRDIERPVLINNWEATYFDFNEDKLVAIAEKAGELGIDLFVLDDGWFGRRNDDTNSLGDWVVNKEKLPNGLDGLARRINEKGLKFGLWLEPEMISPDSDLYRAHPDWCIHIKGRQSSLGRNQLILDLSREDVCQFVIDTVSGILDSANIEYIKWDMNRNMSEIGSALLPADRQSEVAHRFVLGLYHILETLTTRYPKVLFEGCSGGGGRFDGGILHYMPQIWTSDNTDGEERLKLQYGTSMVYPFSSMGAHVSAVPNHQMGRTTPFEFRGNVAVMGQFGYELDLTKLTDEELEKAKEQVAFYKQYGSVMHRGDCYRLSSPFDSNYSVIQFISPDGDTVLVDICCRQALPNAPFKRIRLQALEDEAVYVDQSGREATGGELCSVGINLVSGKEHSSEIIVLRKIK